jgi:hypothetical protein
MLLRRRTMTISGAVALALMATGTGGPVVAQAHETHAAVTRAAPYDFNGDGRPELAVPVPGADDLGRLYVVPGTAEGMGEPAVAPGVTEPDNGITGDEDFWFRWSVTSADFDRDGYADAAIGQPNHARLTGSSPFGAVTVYYGSPSGLSGDRTTVIGSTWAYNSFAESVVTADFNRDGWPDLAVGAPHSDGSTGPSRPTTNTAAIAVLWGSAKGFALSRGYRLTPPNKRDYFAFGLQLAVGDLNKDGRMDLVESGAFGAKGYNRTSYIPGTSRGPRVAHIIGRYAGSLTTGDVTGDGVADLVTGRSYGHYDDVGHQGSSGFVGAGRVTVYRGRKGRSPATGIVLTQKSAGVPGRNEDGDEFGASVVLTDLDDDGRLDIVIGAPGEDVGQVRDAGSVTVVHGAKRGFAKKHSFAITQNTPGVPGTNERFDHFGSSLAALDLAGDGRRDAVVSSPGERTDGGLLSLVVRGRSFDLTSVTSRRLLGPPARIGSSG